MPAHADQSNLSAKTSMPDPLQVEQIPVLTDNYVYLIRDPATGCCAAVDPSVSDPVLAALERLGWHLTHILNTHHHSDHVGGNLAIKAATGCTIVGNAADAARIPGIDVRVSAGDKVSLGAQVALVFDVSGHTMGHIAYWFESSDALFCGDTLFSIGCGRLFEGTPERMWASLSQLRSLPDQTRVYCAHEYTQANAAFALTLEPDNPRLQARVEEVAALRRGGQSTVPSTMELEKATNPFLRVDVDAFRRSAGVADLDPVAAFATIRRQKDVF